MFNTLSSYFSKIKRHFYRAVEDARRPFKRPVEEISDDDEVPIKTSYAPVRKKICPKRDEPFLPVTRTLHFTPSLRCEPQKRSPLRPIPEDELPQSRVHTSEVKITELRKPSSHTAKTIFPWTPIWLQDEDAIESTSRRIIPPRLKSSSKQKLDAGSNKKELQIQRSLSVKGTSEIQPRQCSGIINHRNQIKNTKPLSFPSKRWKSFAAEESFRMEEKKQYQQLLEHCTSNPSLSSAHSISCMSSSSSSSSSPLPCPVYEEKLSKKPSQSIHPVAENVNAIFTPSSEFHRSSKSMVSTCEKKDCSMDKKNYSALYKDPGVRTLQSGAAMMKNASNKTYERSESVIKSGKQLDTNEDNDSLLQLIRRREERENEPVPLIDLASSGSNSDSDDVEIVDEFPQGRKRAEAFKSKVETERMKYRHCKYGSLNQATDIKDNDAENELERRKRISQNFYNKVENRLKLLDIISDSQDKGGIQATRVKPPFVLLTPKMLTEVDAALVPAPKSEVLVHKFNIKITRYDIHTLKGLNWLNDEVINFYMSLIVDRSKDNNHLPSTYAVNSFFYPTLMNRGHQSVSRWTKKVDIFNYDILLVPIHLGVHWCMATVDFKKKCISYYDSMLSNNNKCLQVLLNYLEEEHLDKKKTPYTTTAWNLKNVKDIPEQMNGSDCGVFACQFAEHKSRLAEMDFDQGDMPYFRRRMVYEIINAILLE